MKSYRAFRYLRMRYRRTFQDLEGELEWQLTGRWMLYSVSVGVLVSLAAMLLSGMIHVFTEWALGVGIGYGAVTASSENPWSLVEALHTTRPWLLLVIPPLGGLLSGFLVFRYAPEAEGHGTDAVIRAYHQSAGDIRPRVAVVKALASAITIGSGGSAGKEGPIAQIGATIGSFVGRRLGLTRTERRMLLIAGVAAGIGAIFRSPLGGAFFAVEVLYRDDFEAKGLMPATVAAITGYSVYSTFWDASSVFQVPTLELLTPAMYALVVALAVVCALAGNFFGKTFSTAHRLFARIPIGDSLRPALGGLIVGVIAFWFPAVLGSSYQWLQQAILGNLTLSVMGLLAVAKVVATSASIGSGGSGGVFAPSLVIGGMLGGVFGIGAQMALPDVQPEVFVLIGMATFFAGAANVPLSITVMLSEMIGSYRLLVPLILGGVVAQLLTRRWSLYSEQPETRAESPAHRAELTPDLVSTIRVERVVKHPIYYHTIAPYHDLADIISVFTRTREVVLPVTGNDPASRYVGLVFLDAIQPYLRSDRERPAITAKDIMAPFEWVRLRDTLDTVLIQFEENEYPELPVLDDDGIIVTFIKPSQAVAEYHRAYLREKGVS